nr:unnamed protein product [Callosobruchus analis]
MEETCSRSKDLNLYIQITASTNGRTKRKHSKVNSDIDPVVSQLPTTSSNKDNLDQMFTMFIIPKEDGISVENPGESWNLVGRYDVEEESGTLIPFQSEEDSLFDQHF